MLGDWGGHYSIGVKMENIARTRIAMRIIVAIALCFSAGICVLSGAPIPDSARSFTLPMAIGTKWTYQVKASDERITAVVTAIDSDKKYGKLMTVSYQTTKGETGIWEVVSLDSRQLLTHQEGPFVVDPPFRWVRSPYFQRDKWAMRFTLSTASSHFLYTSEFVQGPVARVVVPAGVFEAVRVDAKSGGFAKSTETRWYASGVGVVKRVDKSGDTLELVSFEPGQKPR